MARNHKRSSHPEEESSYVSEESYEECPVCRQEFAEGVCPINSAECPYQKGADEVDDEDDEDPDFDDVEHLDQVLEEDKEADRLTEEEGEIPEEDLKEEDR
jgi:hypothetical protein